MSAEKKTKSARRHEELERNADGRHGSDIEYTYHYPDRFRPKLAFTDRPMREFEKYLTENPDCLFMTAIELQPEDSKWFRLFQLILNPPNKRQTLAYKARQCGISLSELMNMLSDAQRLRGVMAIMGHIPVVMHQQAIAALEKKVPCVECKGTGRVVDKAADDGTAPCKLCQGTGEVDQAGNDKAIDRTLEMGGVLGGKNGSSNLTVNTHVQVNGVSDVEAAVSGIGRILDVTPVPAQITDGSE